MMFYLLILGAALPAYIIGSVNGAIITSKLFYRKDIRDYGSGNAGLTNFYRTFGKGGVLLVILIDVLKTVVPVLFGGFIFGHFAGILRVDPYYISDIFIGIFDSVSGATLFGRLVAGFFVMLGHCFPLFYKFKGGKAVMAIGAIIIVADWRLALIGWGVFFLITLITRFVSLASMLASASFPIAMYFLDIGGTPEIIVTTLCVLLVVVRHIPNIQRLIKGEESRFTLRRNKEKSVE